MARNFMLNFCFTPLENIAVFSQTEEGIVKKLERCYRVKLHPYKTGRK